MIAERREGVRIASMSDPVALRAMARWHAANPAASQPGNSSSSSSSEDESDEDSGSTSSIDSEIKSDDSGVAIVRRHDHHRKKGNGLLTAADLPLDVRQAAWESADPVALERALHREAAVVRRLLCAP